MDPTVLKDPERECAIARSWRPVFAEIVRHFVGGDFRLRGIPSVVPISPKTAEQMRRYVADYGETLTELSAGTWKTSVARWSPDTRSWQVLVDLWTRESGRSDLVLDAKVDETAGGYRFRPYLIYVP